nr:MAG: replication associated protein [Cressdnaviricota sp.]
MSEKRSRGWCWTINNYTREDRQNIKEMRNDKHADYTCYGYEIGEKNTPHIQGYVHYTLKKSLKQMKVILPRAHLEIAKGTPIENKKYCSKDGDFHEFGELPQQGDRSDLKAIATDIINGKSVSDVMIEHPQKYLQYHRGLEKMENEIEKKRIYDNPIIVKTLPNEDLVYDKSILVVGCEDDLKAFNKHKTVWFYTGKVNNNKLALLCRGVPWIVTVGYETKFIRPDTIVLGGTGRKIPT